MFQWDRKSVYILIVLLTGPDTTKLRRTIHGGFAEFAHYPGLGGYMHTLSPTAQAMFRRWDKRSASKRALTAQALRVAAGLGPPGLEYAGVLSRGLSRHSAWSAPYSSWHSPAKAENVLAAHPRCAGAPAPRRASEPAPLDGLSLETSSASLGRCHQLAGTVSPSPYMYRNSFQSGRVA